MTDKPRHGGRRTPAGGRPRKPEGEKSKNYSISLYPADVAALLAINLDLSKAVRQLIRDKTAQ